MTKGMKDDPGKKANDDCELPSCESDKDVTEIGDYESEEFDFAESQLIDQEETKESSTWSARTSFTADSPYFDAFCDSELHSLNLLSDTLRDIAARAKNFTKTGIMMSEVTQRLAMACKLQRETGDDDDTSNAQKQIRERRKAIGEEMAGTLELLGEVFEETAAAQIAMCKSIESTLGMSLEAFATMEVNTVSILQQEAEESSASAEQLYAKYLNGRMNFEGTPGDSSNKQGGKHGIGMSIKNWSTKRIEKRRAHKEVSNGSSGDDTSLAKATEAANLCTALQQIRLSQANAELKRFQLMKHLISIKHRRNFELGDNALTSAHCFSNYHRICRESVEKVNSRMMEIQKTQNGLREIHANQIVPTWHTREVALVNTLNDIYRGSKEANRVAESIADGDPMLIDQQLLNPEDLEERAQIWNVPELLAKSAGYQRESMPCVLMEGWLYRKNTAMIQLQAWARRWFMMDQDGLYYFREDPVSRKANGANPQFKRVKVCDIVLCTVRELPPDTSGNRFCFQIVTPSEKPLTLQARGPQEYRMWVDGIRATMENKLVHGTLMHGDLHKITLNNGNDRGNDFSVADVDSMSKESDAESNESAAKESKALAQELMSANPCCADCGMADPDWASLNLGVLLCIECSAVHRSLGVHLSKVRSLRLDSLSEGEGLLLRSLGNEKINPIWEEAMSSQTGWKKPTDSADRKTREDWIRGKYMWKGFLSFRDVESLSEEERSEKFSRDLYEAAKKGDVCAAAYALAHGGSVEWVNSEEEGRTPLHICTLAKIKEGQKWKAIETAELLLQNGAKMTAFDSASHDVLDAALIGNAEVKMVEYLTHRSL